MIKDEGKKISLINLLLLKRKEHRSFHNVSTRARTHAVCRVSCMHDVVNRSTMLRSWQDQAKLSAGARQAIYPRGCHGGRPSIPLSLAAPSRCAQPCLPWSSTSCWQLHSRRPVWFSKRVDKIRRGFLWAQEDQARGGKSLVRWTDVCRPKGLGISDLQRQSRALGTRWQWLQCMDPNKPLLWIRPCSPAQPFLGMISVSTRRG